MENDGKVIAMLGAFGLIVGFAYYANTAIEGNSKRDDFLKLQEKVESAKKTIEARRAVLTSTKQNYEGLKQTEQSVREQESAASALAAEKAKLDQAIKDLERTRDAVSLQFVEAVKAVRASSVGMESAELILGNANKLTGTKIKSVSPTEVTFTHSLGIARVPLKDLPDDLKLRFRVGMAPMQSIDEDSLRASPSIVPNSAAPDLGTKNARPKLSVLQAEIARYEQQLAQLDQARTSALSRATVPPRSSGKITSAGVEAAKANQEATTIQIQMNGVNKKLNDLRALLPTALPE